MRILSNYKNGNYNVKLYADGTKIRFTNEDKYVPEFAENIDIKITDCCSAGCPFCHEGSTKTGKHGDILNLKFIDTLHKGQELAIGGGNIFEHPDLEEFLIRLKNMGVISNITVNELHFVKYYEKICALKEHGLIYGVGVSLTAGTLYTLGKLMDFPYRDDIVLHVINGIVTDDILMKFSNRGFKLLILGYKTLRRGKEYKSKFLKSHDINKKQKMLSKNLINHKYNYKVISFDNLAIAQLNIKNNVSSDEWDLHYMGDDATTTFYIDCVNQVFAENSTASLDNRYPICDTVDEMFNKIKKG